MAEAIAIFGIIAAAVQFIETGSKLVLRLRSLSSKIQDSPQCLRQSLDQVQILLVLAERAKRRTTHGDSAYLPAVAQSLQNDQVPSLQLSQTLPLTGLESVWQNCTAQACELDKLIGQLLEKAEGGGFRKSWKKLFTLKDEEDVERLLTRIEKYKTLLSIWYGQECLDGIRTLGVNMFDLRGEMFGIRQNMAHFNEIFERFVGANASESHRGALGPLHMHASSAMCPLDRQVLDMIQDQGRQTFQTRQQVQSLVSRITTAFL